MKNILNIIFILIVTESFSQSVSVDIENLKVNNVSVNSGAPIDMGTNSSVSVTFRVDLEKSGSYLIGSSKVYIEVYDSSGNRTVKRVSPVSENEFIEGVSANFDINISESDINFENGNYLTAILKQDDQPGAEWESQHISIIKKPAFELTPSYLDLSCGDVSQQTFTVTSGANLSGVTYQWYVGNGWLGNVSNGSSITLTPNSGTILPSDISVTPIYNGVPQTTETCIVSRSNFTTTAVISGNNYVCGSEVYIVDNLSNNVTIQSVSSSNTNIATVSLTSNNEITVTKITDGIVNISATLQNLCSQTTTIVKENIQIGIPNFVEDASITGSSAVCQGQTYTYTLNGANHPCVGDANWSVSPNLNVLAQTGTTITVSKNPFSADNAGFITANIPDSDYEFSKGVWVGLPNNQSLSIQKVGVYDLYVDRWTLLKANFTGFQYVVNEPFNLTYDWSIPNSMVRNSFDPSLKSVKPYSIGQLNIGVRVLCDCA